MHVYELASRKSVTIEREKSTEREQISKRERQKNKKGMNDDGKNMEESQGARTKKEKRVSLTPRYTILNPRKQTWFEILKIWKWRRDKQRIRTITVTAGSVVSQNLRGWCTSHQVACVPTSKSNPYLHIYVLYSLFSPSDCMMYPGRNSLPTTHACSKTSFSTLVLSSYERTIYFSKCFILIRVMVCL